MGLDARIEILAWLRELCPLAFLKSLPFMTNWVCIEDVLTRMPRLSAPRKSRLFTGIEASDAIMGPAFQNFSHGCIAHVYCCDDQARVPRRKEEEHKKRDGVAIGRVAKRISPKNKAIDKTPRAPPVYYASQSRIVDDGIWNPTTGKTEMFDLFALSRNRGLRPELMSYLALRAARLHQQVPAGCRILLDFDRDGAVELYGRQGQTARIRCLETHRHPFGEADLACAYWVGVYCEEFDCVYNSIDSDVLPIINKLISILKPSRRIIWNDGLGTILDMNQVNHTLQRMGITAEHFVAVCAAAGCDWVDSQPFWPRLEGGNFTRIRKGMACYELFGKQGEITQLTLPLHLQDECYWKGMLHLMRAHESVDVQKMLAVHMSMDPAGIVASYWIPEFQYWDESKETEFERCIREMSSKIMGSRFCKIDREALRKETHKLAWTVQYWCVPWHEMQLQPPPNG